MPLSIRIFICGGECDAAKKKNNAYTTFPDIRTAWQMYSSAASGAKSIMHQKVRERANTKGSPVFFELGPKIPSFSFSVFTFGKTKVGLAKREGERKKGASTPPPQKRSRKVRSGSPNG